MNSTRFNIYAGSILGGLLLFLLLNFFSGLLYYGPEHAGEGEELLAFAVPVEEPAAEGEGEAPKEPDWAELVAQAEPADGEKVFNKCKACHSVEKGDHGVGPSLHNVVGTDIASTEGFSYSEALSSLEGKWTLQNLSAFLEDPQGYAPGTKMSFGGLPSIEDRVAVIEYLNQTGDSPVELVTEKKMAAAEAEGQAAEGEQQGAEGEQQAAEGQQQAAAEGAGGDEYAELLANASADNGEKIFRKCQACHTLEEGKHRVGPSLHGVISSDIGSAEGYNYSDAMKSFEGEWTLSNLMAYLENPNEFIPGNKMTFAGLKDPQDRVDVFTYIDQSDDERDLPAPQASAEGEQQAAEGEQQATEEGQQQAAAETGEAASGDGGEAAAGGGEYAELLANASAENGEKVYRKCQACHTVEEGKHRVGPSLWGVVGRDAASAEGYNYSDALKEFEGKWTLANLDAYLEKPNEFIPGNKMTFPGVRDAQDRIDVITYINQADGSPVELGAASGAATEEEQAAQASGEAAQESGQAASESAGATAQEGGQEAEQTAEATAQEEDGGAEGGGEYAELLAAADAEAGKKVYRKCQACHTLEEGKHRVGPALYGVIGGDVASAEGFNYSDALKEFEGKWTLANLDAYLEKPNEFIPGNKMPFAGLNDPQDRINVLTYIDQSDGEQDLPQ